MTEIISKPFTGRKFFVFLALFFLAIFSANGFLIAKALQSHSGLVTENAYEKGLAYNQTLEQAEFQKSFRWARKLSFSPDYSEIVYEIKDAKGAFVTGKAVAVKMVRPVREGYDFDVILTQGKDGRYHAPFKSPLKGSWNAHISVTWDGGTYYDDVPVILE